MADTHAPRIPAWPPKSAPRLFVAGPLEAGQTLLIEGTQAHYLARVMRVGAGNTVILCDDRTGEWAARVAATDRHRVSVEIAEHLRPREAVPDVWLCPALLKKDRFTLLLEKATELGADAIRPVLARRCVADSLNLERARATLIEAAEQCARTALPRLEAPERLDALLRAWPDGRTLFFADEEGGTPAAAAFARAPGPAGFLVGPEGGWDPAEREAIRAHPGAVPISLGPRILRAETAALAALSLWMGNAGDWSGQF